MSPCLSSPMPHYLAWTSPGNKSVQSPFRTVLGRRREHVTTSCCNSATQVGFLEVSTVTVRRAALSCSLREVPARVEALFSTHAFEYGLLHRGFVATLPKASLVGGGRRYNYVQVSANLTIVDRTSICRLQLPLPLQQVFSRYSRC